MARRKQPSIPDQLLDQLLAGDDPRDTLAGKDGVLEALKKALAERALNAEMDHHLKSGEPDGRPNTRNGYGRKTVLTGTCLFPKSGTSFSTSIPEFGTSRRLLGECLCLHDVLPALPIAAGRPKSRKVGCVCLCELKIS